MRCKWNVTRVDESVTSVGFSLVPASPLWHLRLTKHWTSLFTLQRHSLSTGTCRLQFLLFLWELYFLFLYIFLFLRMILTLQVCTSHYFFFAQFTVCLQCNATCLVFCSVSSGFCMLVCIKNMCSEPLHSVQGKRRKSKVKAGDWCIYRMVSKAKERLARGYIAAMCWISLQSTPTLPPATTCSR